MTDQFNAIIKRGLARKKEVSITIGVIVLLFFIVYGFNTKTLETSFCSSESTIFMQANFSEINSGYDFEGNYYSETDYWDERVSEKYYVRMHNLEVNDANIEYTLNGDIAYPSTNFHYSKAAQKHSDFDNFSLKKSSTILQHFTNGEYVSINNNSYSQCYLSINEPTKVKYWYSIAYGI